MNKAALLLSSCFVLASCVAPATAIPRGGKATGAAPAANTYLVQTSCAQPPNTPTGTTYYVKPGGSDAANGLTLGTAWATPAHAVATMSTSAGDVALLQTGSYGSLTISGKTMTAFTYLKADVGQTPLFTDITVTGSAKWVLHGLKYQQQRQAGDLSFEPFLDITGTNSNIVSYAGDFSSDTFANVSTWTQADWQAKARWVAVSIYGGTFAAPSNSCIAIDNSTIKYTYFGTFNFGTKLILDTAVEDWLGGDYNDFGGDHITLSNVVGTNSIDVGDHNHTDFMQGQIGLCATGTTPNSCINDTIVLNANSFKDLASPASQVPLTSVGTPDEAQCLSMFNTDWQNVTITNNLCVVHGASVISLLGVHTALIANNTAIDYADGNGGVQVTTGSPGTCGCSTPNAVTMRNNVAQDFGYDMLDATTTMEYNTALSGGHIFYNKTGSVQFLSSPGTCSPTCGTANVLTATANSAIFTTYDAATPLWDLTPKALSILLNAGTLPAPACINGVARPVNPNQGAYC